jgi:hypothetical protein
MSSPDRARSGLLRHLNSISLRSLRISSNEALAVVGEGWEQSTNGQVVVAGPSLTTKERSCATATPPVRMLWRADPVRSAQRG